MPFWKASHSVLDVVIDRHVDGVDVARRRGVARARGVPVVRVLDQRDRLVVHPLLDHVRARADRLVEERLAADLLGVVDGEHLRDVGCTSVTGNSANGYCSVTWRVYLSSTLTPVRPFGRAIAAGGVDALDGREDVRTVADWFVGSGDVVPRVDEVLRRDLAVHGRREHDALLDGEREQVASAVDLASSRPGRARPACVPSGCSLRM